MKALVDNGLNDREEEREPAEANAAITAGTTRVGTGEELTEDRITTTRATMF